MFLQKVRQISSVVSIVLLVGGYAAAQDRVMTAEDVVMYHYVSEIAISPDGSQVAYVTVVPRNPFTEKNGSAWRELHLADLDGNTRPFVAGNEKVSNIAWTPDGRFVSFLEERKDDEDKALYRIPITGGESQKVVEFPQGIRSYTWSPDSRTVAFLAKDTITEDQRKLEDVGFDAEVYEERWKYVRVWMVDVDKPGQIARSLELPGSADNLTWSPDGRTLAMTLAPSSLIDDRYMFRRVTMVDVESGKIRHQFENRGKVGEFVWSPDGTWLAFISGADMNDPREGELWVAPADGSELKPIITDFDGHINEVGWLDAKTMVYLADRGPQTKLGYINIDGSDQGTLVPESTPIFTDMDISADGQQIVLTGSAYNYPNEVFVFDTSLSSPERLTNVNPWMDSIRFAEQEVIDFRARDGLELQGILIHPLDEQPGRRYPLILSVHGGPESHVRDGWVSWYSSPGQVAAAKGFAVFYPNYRGSTGRGVEFSKMGQADYAGGEFNDLVDAITHFVDIGLVDEDRVGITGRSYGGYATAWACTKLSEHFAAGVMGAGVSDLVSKFGTTDIPQEMYYVHARLWPWEDWDYYRERSPIYHAQNAKTPLLILHGKEDTRVHPSQSMELYRYLKTLNQVPVRLVLYPGEQHGTSKAAARYDSFLRMMRWLEHYLIGPGGDPPPYELDYSRLEGAPAANQ